MGIDFRDQIVEGDHSLEKRHVSYLLKQKHLTGWIAVLLACCLFVYLAV